MPRLRDRAKRFKIANDISPVTQARVLTDDGGGRYWLEDGSSYILSTRDVQSLPEGYPIWKHKKTKGV